MARAPNRIRVVSYNIHKGFSAGNRVFVLREIKKALTQFPSDLLCLQEVLGAHAGHSKKVQDWPTESQFEFLADTVWPHFAYGRNAVYTSGHHGNAILSKYPIEWWSNFDISTNRMENRGYVHAQIRVPGHRVSVHCISVHLGLLQRSRQVQLKKMIDRLAREVPKHEPLLIAGDFNDWSHKATTMLEEQLNLKEAYHATHGKHPRTFPSRFPVLCLDRIYFRGFELRAVQILNRAPWNKLSDHAALYAELSL